VKRLDKSRHRGPHHLSGRRNRCASRNPPDTEAIAISPVLTLVIPADQGDLT